MQLWTKIGFPAILVVLAFMPEYALIEAKDFFVGDYQCERFFGTPTLNNWHFIKVTKENKGYRWSNRAGVSWLLYKKSSTVLGVGKDSPYFKKGLETAVFSVQGVKYGEFCKRVGAGADCMADNGKTYRGPRSYTASGVACKKWEDALGSQYYWKPGKMSFIPSNYCRNPVLPAIARGYGYRAAPWCYKEDGKKGEAGGWEYCSIPKCGNGCIKGDGRKYQGTKSVTNTGVKCKNWDDALGSQYYWNSGKVWRFLPGDYCRNPVLPAIARGYGYRAAPWCYKEDGKKGEAGGWAYCSVPKC